MTPAPGFDSETTLFGVLERYLPSLPQARHLADRYFEVSIPSLSVGRTPDSLDQVLGWVTAIVPLGMWETYLFPQVFEADGRPNLASVEPQCAAVVFLVFAIGARLDLCQPPNDREADSLFNAAKLCLALDCTQSVRYVQAIMLYGYFAMNGTSLISGGDSFWPLLRMALGIAQALGLHRDDVAGGLSSSERLERRIIFWEAHSQDVLQSMALGRGQCIPRNAISSVEVDVDGHGYHVQTCKLCSILSQINDLQVKVGASRYSDVLAIDSDLTAFESSLPEHLVPSLRPAPADLTDPVQKRTALQSNLLSLYINEARVALHRGWFVQALKHDDIEPMKSPHQQSFLMCLEACRSIVSAVSNMVALQGLYITKRWHYIFHLFSACVCFAAVGIRAPRSALALAALAQLDAGVAVLELAGREEFVSHNGAAIG